MACLCQEVAGKDVELSPTGLGQLWMFDNLTPSEVAALTRGAETNEEKMAQEIRDLAYAELNTDVASVKSEITKISDDIKKIRRGFNSFTDTTGSIIPLFSLLTKALAKKK